MQQTAGLIDALIAHASLRAHAPAVVEGERVLDYENLLRSVRAGAAWLQASGVRSGDIVALSMRPTPGAPFRELHLFYALVWLGAVVLPIYPDVTPRRCAELLAHFRARWLLGVQGIDAALDPPVAPPGFALLDPGDFDPRDVRWNGADPPRGDRLDRGLHYNFSSGTTGTPKAVLFVGGQCEAMSRSAATALGWTNKDRLVPALPWPHKVGLRAMMRMHLVGGAPLNEPFPETRDQLTHLIEEFDVTSLGSSPWQLRRLLASPAPSNARARKLRYLHTAGASIAAEEIRAARATLTPRFYVAYGATETGVIAVLPPSDPHDAPLRPVPGLEVAVLDAGGRVLPRGEVGTLRLRAAWIPSTYADNPAATAIHFHDDWFQPGDAASVDVHGRIALYGRIDDVINVGGAKLLPHNVESVLAAHPAVATAAVLGLPDPMAGEIAVAFVVVTRPVSGQTLIEHCRPQLGSHMPTRMVFVNQIPRNAEGKVLREPLLEAYRAWRVKAEPR